MVRRKVVSLDVINHPLQYGTKKLGHLNFSGFATLRIFSFQKIQGFVITRFHVFHKF